MARLIALVLLRWRVDLRAITRARERLFGLLLMVPGMLLFSVFGSVAVLFGFAALERAQPDAVLPLLSTLAAGVGLFWALSPLLAGVAFTETHDMSRLLHFPIPLPTLVVSSLVANLAQPTVLAELPILLALAVATGGLGLRFPLALLGVLLSFVLILAVSQVVGLVLHGLSRNRRAHDWSLFIGLALAMALSLAPLLLLVAGPGVFGRLLAVLVELDPLGWCPFGWGVRAAVHAGRGQLLPFVVHAGGGMLAIAAAMGTATLLMQLIYRGELNLGGTGSEAGSTPGRMLFRGRVGALLEKDLRSAWRDPAVKATLFMGLVGPLLFLLFIFHTSADSRSGTAVLLLASFVGLSGFGTNAFGLERRGVALLLGFPMERFWLLVGKNLAALFYRLPSVLVLLLAGVFLAPVTLLPAAASIALATLLIACAADNYLSILFPVAAPEPGKNPYGGPGSGGRGFASFALTTLLIPGILIVAGPFAFLAWLPLLLGQPLLWWLSLPLAVGGAAATYAILVAGAARLLARREPELLERILSEA